MTRETKVGLVVGTGIILLIGIVVSDHLASQQRGAPQTAAPTGYVDAHTGQPLRTIDPRQTRPLSDGSSQPGAGHPASPLPPAGSPRGNDIGNGQRTTAIGLNNIDNGGNASGTPGSPATSGSSTDAGSPVVDRNLAAALNGSNTPASSGGTANSPADAGLPRGLATDLRGSGFLAEDPTPRLANPTGAVSDNHRIPGNVRATEPLIHHVQSGESLWAISEKFYGDGRHYKDIALANADKLLPDGGVREGVRLVIPNKTIANPGTPVVSGNTLVNDPRTGSNTSTPGGTPGVLADRGVSSNAAPALRTIKVESGDALSTIASRELGSIRHMQLIIDANKDQIDDANDIKAGMTLRIPALPAPSGAANVATPGGATHAAPGRSVTESVTTSRNVKTYTVQPRDNFSSIARSRLGDDRRWKELFELNRDKVRTPDALRPGVVLTLPADAR